LKQTLKSILQRYIDQMQILHEVPNRFPPSTLGSVDAFGWFAVQLERYFLFLQKHDELLTYFTIDELNTWFVTIQESLHYAKDTRGVGREHAQLFSNTSQETWMDTTYHDDGRPGLRVEIQALFAAVYRVLVLLADYLPSQDASALQAERKEFIASVRALFVPEHSRTHILDGVYLDGRTDDVFRPNLFLAAHVAPELFTKSDWHIAFERHVEALYLSWGGFATLEKEHSLYQPTYTGQNNKSYHRGDSWYFVNNIAALVLYRHDRKRYASLVQEVLQASAKDLLDLGFAGHASEISSAAFQSGDASPVQTWSMATYLELVLSVYEKDD
jgi:glycogen debranching enzyme